MKAWYQSKIIWACIIGIITALGEAIVVTPFDWKGFAAACFLAILAMIRAWGTSTAIGSAKK
jgi:hypothetical protein